ncbi:transporter substrate-binding domain-containing protein [Antarctobacter heliothermus]|uniref:ABC-type amino acid transport substrate-binding protein n=1 Tax=Antarctobacter heliothermus TaxID=74033 RepID=A0A239EVH0_9RHOB|nr:transporter substrate-binding domain-containing protein [Antarctobacter heliothermus]SNS48587.1 ABC-type amino acid transport substrate-binding protein [Antarctobacter heliothermus]
MPLRWITALFIALGLGSGAQAQGLPDCGFGFEIDRQSSAFQSMLVDGEQKRGFWLSINRAPSDVKQVARHIGRLQVCLMTPDGQPRTLTRGGQTFTLDSPFLSNCTAALLPDNRLLTNAHCFCDPDLVRAGFTVVREARINFNYTSSDDTGAVLTYLVAPREVALDKDLDALLLQILGADANTDLGGHIPMKMMTRTEPNQELRMIHHPGADPQQYSTGTCQVHRRQSEIPDTRSPFRHSCESTGGSSGSLLLDARTLAVVALHNQGGLKPTGDSFNGGHKIALINQAFNLGFQELAPTGGDNRDGDADRALSDALLTAELTARVTALRGVISRFAGTEAAEKAQTAATRLETDLAQKDRNALAIARLDRAKSAKDTDTLRAMLQEFDGTALGFQVQLALFEVEAAQRVTESQANAALTAALLLTDPNAKMAALERITREHAAFPAARQATTALQRLRAASPAPKPPTTTPPVKTLLGMITSQQLDQMARKGGTQSDVIHRGHLNCGVSIGILGFSYSDDRGDWQGLDVDLCRAVAAAVLDNPNAVEFVPTTPATQFIALASGEVDLLGGNVSQDDVRGSGMTFLFPGVSVQDGVAMMVPRNLGVSSVKHLDGATVCLRPDTQAELALADYFSANNMFFEPVPTDTFDDSLQKYLSLGCDVLLGNRSDLASIRATETRPDDHRILPELLSSRPLGPVVRADDRNWADIVGGVLDAAKLAAKLNLSQDDLRFGAPASGVHPDLLGGTNLNLPDDFLLRVVRAVGNLEEMFKRNFDEDASVFLSPG